MTISADATPAGGLEDCSIGDVFRRLFDVHRPCRQAVSEIAALVTADRDRERDADRVAADAVVWLEQRAGSYLEDARHLRARHPDGTDADRIAKAVAAELRQAAVDVAHALAQR